MSFKRMVTFLLHCEAWLWVRNQSIFTSIKNYFFGTYI